MRPEGNLRPMNRDPSSVVIFVIPHLKTEWNDAAMTDRRHGDDENEAVPPERR